jgi:hypothetical protein
MNPDETWTAEGARAQDKIDNLQFLLGADSDKTAKALADLGRVFKPFSSVDHQVWSAGIPFPSSLGEELEFPETEIMAEEGLAAILEEIKASPDSLKAAGDWLTKITTEIAAVTRQELEE